MMAVSHNFERNAGNLKLKRKKLQVNKGRQISVVVQNYCFPSFSIFLQKYSKTMVHNRAVFKVLTVL